MARDFIYDEPLNWTPEDFRSTLADLTEDEKSQGLRSFSDDDLGGCSHPSRTPIGCIEVDNNRLGGSQLGNFGSSLGTDQVSTVNLPPSCCTVMPVDRIRGRAAGGSGGR